MHEELTDDEIDGRHLLIESTDHLGVDQVGTSSLSNTYLKLPRRAAITGSVVKSAQGQRLSE
jgi:hypothetical protein